MSAGVRILLDNPHTFYTNLDFISGRILLTLTSDENISAIIVKLEGESRTMLMRPMQQPNDPRIRQRQVQGLAMENHKILYRVNQVFPSQEPGQGPMMGSAYTLRAGQHEYPFRFKIPINNGCWDPSGQQMGPGSGFGGFGLGGLQQMQYRHVKKTLPPSLTGFPGEAEIRYYVKVTVQRPSIFKENRRNAVGFKFLPIEPPRPLPTANEVYARRPFEFTAGLAGYAQKKGGLFGKRPAPTRTLSSTPPKGEIDARLPSPAILTCNKPLPLRLILRKLNDSPEQIFLTSLQVHLFASTEVRAQDVVRTETGTWVLLSLNNLKVGVGKEGDKMGTETVISDELWNGVPLPSTVTPSFGTCNLGRGYEVEVRVGLGWGVVGDIQPQTITLPLRFSTEIYSGISPPTALLAAAALASSSSHPLSSSPSSSHPIPPFSSTHQVPPQSAGRPTQTYDPAYPPQLGPGGMGSEEAPPSYEDAMAGDAIVVDGGSRIYSGVTDVDAPEVGGGGKKGGKGAPPGYSGGAGGGGGGGRGGVV